MTVLAAAGLTRRFGSLVAVRRVDLSVEAGEVVGLIGANGAGKTTLIRMLLGLLDPTEGEALLFGEPPSRRSRVRVGYVPQGLGLWEDLTVAENLAFAAAAYGRRAEVALEPELGSVGGTLVRHLSLGLRRRVAFAACLAHRPDVLVLDEPTSGVGPLARADLWDRIRREAERGAGILVSTHYMTEAEQCDRLVVLSMGGVVAEGHLDQVLGGAGSFEEAFVRFSRGGAG